MKIFEIKNNQWVPAKLNRNNFNWNYIKLYDDNFQFMGYGIYPSEEII